MIIHNKGWLENLHIAREAKQWRASKIISDAQYDAIRTKYTTLLYTPTLFIRIVLFVFTCIALCGVYGIVFLVADSSNASVLASICVVVGLLSLVALEAIIKKRKLYRAGIEEALLYASLCLTIGGVVWLYLDGTSGQQLAVISWIIALPFLLWGVARFADWLVTAGAYLCALAVVLVPLVEGSAVPKVILPFTMMLFAVVSYFFARRYHQNEVLTPWRGCLFIIELLSLATFYCGGNYFVVREGNEMLKLMSATLYDGDIPFAFLFYGLTAVIPVGYITRGLIVRDHLLLRGGLIASVLSVLTFRYYFHFVPPEVALTVAGLALFLTALFTSQFLKIQRNGFTEKNIMKEKLKDLNAEGLLIAHTLGASPLTTEKKTEGGGGEFGGGGTSGTW